MQYAHEERKDLNWDANLFEPTLPLVYSILFICFLFLCVVVDVVLLTCYSSLLPFSRKSISCSSFRLKLDLECQHKKTNKKTSDQKCWTRIFRVFFCSPPESLFVSSQNKCRLVVTTRLFLYLPMGLGLLKMRIQCPSQEGLL